MGSVVSNVFGSLRINFLIYDDFHFNLLNEDQNIGVHCGYDEFNILNQSMRFSEKKKKYFVSIFSINISSDLLRK